MALFGKKQENEKFETVPGAYVAKKFLSANKLVAGDELLFLYTQAANYANENNLDIVKISEKYDGSVGVNVVCAIFKKA